MAKVEVLFVFVLAAITALAEDRVLLKPVPTPRFQHVQNNNGLLDLVDLWVKTSDLEQLARYNPDTENIYYVFTRAQPNIGYPMLLGYNDLLALTDFNPQRKTVVLVHGWTGSVLAGSNLALIPAFLTAEDVNVVVVDWNAGASGNYMTSVANTVTSGESAARFIIWLNNVTGASLSDYHLVGHSLGGHQVGIIGRNAPGIAYITALDPAYPQWVLNANQFKADDGLYTEVIHSHAGGSGFLEPIGHVDFYPNGGINMPGCDGQSCDHDRCFHYMAESVMAGGFEGVECPTYLDAMAGACDLPGRLNMGGVEPKTGSTGIYYLQTNASPPFSIQ